MKQTRFGTATSGGTGKTSSGYSDQSVYNKVNRKRYKKKTRVSEENQNCRSFPKFISYERSKLPFLNIFFPFMQETVFCAVLKIISTCFRVNLSWTYWIAIVQRTFASLINILMEKKTTFGNGKKEKVFIVL